MAISTVSGELALDPLITCKLCLCEYPMKEMHQMQGCSCVYCILCLRQYLSILIQESAISSITCPDAACREKGKVLSNEVKFLVKSEVFERYKQVKFELEVDLDPSRTWCPEVGCETICHVCNGDPSKAKPVHCPTCGKNFCSICKSHWHANLSCGEYMGTLTHKASSSSQVLEALGIPFDNEDVAKIKRCPMCHIPIERDEGCAQMMCKRCKHVFCWYCLANLDDDFLLRHYDKGPCKNKLGHSRASVIWHRTQVIGIFAGFGLLLFLASPFLLLVAPCILCCKCKWCRCCDEDDDLPPA